MRERDPATTSRTKRLISAFALVVGVSPLANGCSSAIEGTAHAAMAPGSQELANYQASQKFTRAARYIAGMTNCVAGNPSSGITNLDPNHLSNAPHILGPDGIAHTADDWAPAIAVEVMRGNDMRGNFMGWQATWRDPNTPAKMPLDTTFGIAVTGVLPDEAKLINTPQGDGMSFLGLDSAIAGEHSMQPDRILFQDRDHSVILEQHNGVVYNATGDIYGAGPGPLPTVSPVEMDNYARLIGLNAELLVRGAQINPDNCNVH